MQQQQDDECIAGQRILSSIIYMQTTHHLNSNFWCEGLKSTNKDLFWRNQTEGVHPLRKEPRALNLSEILDTEVDEESFTVFNIAKFYEPINKDIRDAERAAPFEDVDEVTAEDVKAHSAW